MVLSALKEAAYIGLLLGVIAAALTLAVRTRVSHVRPEWLSKAPWGCDVCMSTWCGLVAAWCFTFTAFTLGETRECLEGILAYPTAVLVSVAIVKLVKAVDAASIPPLH